MDHTALTITEASGAIRRGEMTAQAYAEALLKQSVKANGLNAFIELDPEQVLEGASAADQVRRAGSPLGGLHGIPLALKDNLDTAAGSDRLSRLGS